MQLIISTRGTYLHVHEECFEIKMGQKRHQFSFQRIDSIVVSVSAAISTDALKAAAENNVDVVFLDEFGNPFGRFWHCRMGSTAKIRRKQLEIAESEYGLELVKEWIVKKIGNQLRLLHDLARNRDALTAATLGQLEDQLAKIQKDIKNTHGDLEEQRGRFMGLEGTAGRLYFEALSGILPDKWKFTGRSRNPARDPFNCFLNYGYGVLYSMTERGCILAGLDPFLGFLHTDGYGKKSLVFDLVELYRYWADEVVFKLFSTRKVKPSQMDELHGGYTLNKEGKTLLMKHFNEFLDVLVTHGKRKAKRRDLIQLDCHRIAQQLLQKPDRKKSKKTAIIDTDSDAEGEPPFVTF